MAHFGRPWAHGERLRLTLDTPGLHFDAFWAPFGVPGGSDYGCRAGRCESQTWLANSWKSRRENHRNHDKYASTDTFDVYAYVFAMFAASPSPTMDSTKVGGREAANQVSVDNIMVIR